MIHSDLHIHSEYSYDAVLPLATILEKAKERGYRQVGVTDHLNLPNNKFIGCLSESAKHVLEAKKTNPILLLGVELTPIEKPFYDFNRQNPTSEGYSPAGYTPPNLLAGESSYPLEMALSKEELMAYGVQYAVAAAHGYIDVPHPDVRDKMATIAAWERMQLYLAADERTTILGHPYYHGLQIWYDDFSVIPYSTHEELAAALVENGKYLEMNVDLLVHPKTTELFRHQYAEYMRFMFEKGVRITYGSDSHGGYGDQRPLIYPYLEKAGFKDGDFSELDPADLWQ